MSMVASASLLLAALAGCTAGSTQTGPDGRDPGGRAVDTALDTGTGPDTADTDTGTADVGVMKLVMLDVWQGDAVLVVAPSGQTMLFDAGDEADYTEMARELRTLGIEHIDATVVSHMHADHMGAMDLALWDHPEVAVAYDGGSLYYTDSYDDYIEAAGERRQIVDVGDELDLGPNLRVEVLHSSIADPENENNNSVVLKFTHGAITAMVGGDCEGLLCERELSPGKIDVYKVHHHGSSDSSTPTLLREMEPSVALIGVGRGNDYGHPHDETIEALEQAGATVYRTDQNGNIVVESDGRNLTVTPDDE